MPHIFERFYRATSARGMPGSGLGLAIVRQVAEAHGGTIDFEPAPGGGTLMRLRLPLHDAAHDGAFETPAAGADAGAGAAEAGGQSGRFGTGSPRRGLARLRAAGLDGDPERPARRTLRRPQGEPAQAAGRVATISAAIASATWAGARPPRSIPAGPWIRSSSSSEKPCAASAARRRSCVRLAPIAPM